MKRSDTPNFAATWRASSNRSVSCVMAKSGFNSKEDSGDSIAFLAVAVAIVTSMQLSEFASIAYSRLRSTSRNIRIFHKRHVISIFCPRVFGNRAIGFSNGSYEEAFADGAPVGARLTVVIHPRDSSFVLDFHTKARVEFLTNAQHWGTETRVGPS